MQCRRRGGLIIKRLRFPNFLSSIPARPFYKSFFPSFTFAFLLYLQSVMFYVRLPRQSEMLDQISKRKGSDRNQKFVCGTGINSGTECAQITPREEKEKQKERTRLGDAG